MHKLISKISYFIDVEEQVEDEADEEDHEFDDYFMSSAPTPDGPAQTQGNAGNGTASSIDHGASSKRLSGKKRKQVDILERMADEVHESTAAQREHVQILANAISGKNEEVKMGEKLEHLGFADHDALHVVVKICSDARLEKSFWSLTDAQLTALAQDVTAGNGKGSHQSQTPQSKGDGRKTATYKSKGDGRKMETHESGKMISTTHRFMTSSVKESTGTLSTAAEKGREERIDSGSTKA
ncbi:hypothetical protein PIB30_020619 [Stylosanthes scabra]|uniref:Uncharacterized protein n=1 Tax=Stylosanthes scabra TaxID=79078 RepID=A0ABU6S8L5_9FABA|nr:hypothetical protein [Stylosanthes scabra]